MDQFSTRGASRAAPELEEIERIGPYEVVRRVGVGGDLFLGRHIDTRRLCAVRVLSLPHALARPDTQERLRFCNRAGAMAAISYPGLAPVEEVGEHRGRPFAATPWFAGGSLRDLIGRLRASDLEDARNVGRDSLPGSGSFEARASVTLARVADALSVLHAKGIAHGGLRPSSVMFDGSGGVWLAGFDFAVRPWHDRVDSYLAPERLDSRELTQEADLFGLGATSYELLTFQRPFTGADVASIARALRAGVPRLPSALQPHVPHDADAVCLAAIERDPRRRTATASEMADDLLAVASGSPVRAHRPSLLRRAFDRATAITRR